MSDTKPEPMTPEWWADETRQVRVALVALGIELPPCLPGQEEECDRTFAEHYACELGMLMAKAQILIEVNTPEMADTAREVFGTEYGKLYKEFLAGTHMEPRA